MDISCLFSHLSVDGYLGYFHSFGLPCGSTGKESACNVGDLGLIPGLGRSTGEGKAIHSSILAWRIPWTKSMGSQRVAHDRVTFTFKAKLTGQQERFKKITYLKTSSRGAW